MSPLTKILIVLLTISSVFLCATVVSYVASATDYKQESGTLDTQLRAAKQKVKGIEKDWEQTKDKFQREQKNLEGQITALKAEFSQIKIELGTPQKPNVDTLQPNHMDLIPTRVAEVVREELTRFFQNMEVVKIKQD